MIHIPKSLNLWATDQNYHDLRNENKIEKLS